MGVQIGASGSSSKSKTDNKLDPWAKATFESAFNPALNILGSTHMTPYGGALTTGLDPLQTQAADMAKANVGAGQGALGQAMHAAGSYAGYTPQNVAAGSRDGMDLSGYSNPYLQATLDASILDLDRARQMATVGNSQSATQSGAWGGSRHGVADSLTNDAYLRQVASLEANARNDAYNNSMGWAGQDQSNSLNAALANQQAGLAGASFGLNAANSLANMGAQQQQMGMADAAMLNQFGAQAQSNAQAGLDATYQEWLRQQQYPFLQAGAYGSLVGAVPTILDSSQKGSGVSAGIQGTFGKR